MLDGWTVQGGNPRTEQKELHQSAFVNPPNAKRRPRKILLHTPWVGGARGKSAAGTPRTSFPPRE